MSRLRWPDSMNPASEDPGTIQKAWADGYDVPLEATGRSVKSINGRFLFNIFLIGSALSVLNGVVGGLIVQWGISGRRTLALAVGIVVFTLTNGLWLWARWDNKRLVALPNPALEPSPKS